MWFCFNDGFVSAVQNRNDESGLVIRARRRGILDTLFSKDRVVVGGSTDYNYRVFCHKEEWKQIVAERIMEIDYPNFKDSVEDDDLHDLYAKFWGLHYRYQK